MSTEEVRAHRAQLLEKLDTIEAQFKDFLEFYENEKREYDRRANRFKLGLLSVGMALGVVTWVAINEHETSNKLQTFVECQAAFNETQNRATAFRAKAGQAYSTATLAYGQVQADPMSTPEQIAAARNHYYNTLREQVEIQRANPIPPASVCRLEEPK